MSSALTLSRGIDRLAQSIRAIAARDRAPDPELISIAEELELSSQLCFAIEQELEVFRLMEAGRSGRAMVETLAAEATSPLLDGSEKIVRPDFGRQS